MYMCVDTLEEEKIRRQKEKGEVQMVALQISAFLLVSVVFLSFLSSPHAFSYTQKDSRESVKIERG